jgi:hypothetical protein
MTINPPPPKPEENELSVPMHRQVVMAASWGTNQRRDLGVQNGSEVKSYRTMTRWRRVREQQGQLEIA